MFQGTVSGLGGGGLSTIVLVALFPFLPAPPHNLQRTRWVRIHEVGQKIFRLTSFSAAYNQYAIQGVVLNGVLGQSSLDSNQP